MTGAAPPPALFPNDRPLPEIMAFLHRAELTGELRVTAEAGSRSLVFSQGEIRAVRSEFDQEKLGSWLVATGVIDEDRMALGLLEQLRRRRAQLGQLLVKGGHVSQQAIDHSLERLAMAIVERATADRRQGIVFDDQTGDGPETLINTNTRQLILTSARMVSSQKDHRRLLGSLRKPTRLSVPLGTLLLQLEISDEEKALLRALEQTFLGSLADIQGTLEMSPQLFLSTAYNLVVSGLVEFHREPARAPEVRRDGAGQPRPASDEEMLINLERAEKLVEIGNAEGALRLLEDLAAEEQQPAYLIVAARIMVREEMSGRKVLSTLRKALEADPGLVEGWEELALFWRRRGNRQREAKALKQILDLQPQHHQARARYRQLS